jgi:acetyl esterase
MTARQKLRLDWLNGDVGELRSVYERACSVPGSNGGTWIDTTRGGRPLRALVHEPRRALAKNCAIIYFHGGGWIVGSPATHADISGALCEKTGLPVISVEYRLAPEHKAPAPVEDGLLILEYFLSRSERNTAFLCGDSAGAAIAMAAERASPPQLRSRTAGVCSFYGAFGLADSSSLRLYGDRILGTDPECINRFWTLAHRDASSSPYAIAALRSDSMVPVYLLVCGQDPLRDDSLVLAKALRADGRDVVVDLVESGTHGFLHEQASTLAACCIASVASWIGERRSAARMAKPG